MSNSSERLTGLITEFPPAPFTYEPDTMKFLIGDDSIPLKDFAEHNMPTMESVTELEALRIMNESALAYNVFDSLYQFPMLTNWLKLRTEQQTAQVQDYVTDVMIAAYRDLGERVPRQLLRGSQWGFGMGFYRPGHPSFTVLGDCACFGVSLYGGIGEEMWDDGFAEYGFHNIDWSAQRTTLLAGAGALSSTCQVDLMQA